MTNRNRPAPAVDAGGLLQRHFGFSGFKPGQREVIECLLAGRSAAAVFPTGGGKSLCYQLPALVLDGVTLVVSPLIALMKDQIDALAARGIRARRLDSTLSAEGYRETMDELRRGDLRLLYVAPERFNNERFREMLRHVKVALFAVDEAHCISEWGHNFRPDYLKLAEFAKRYGAERVLALTATATPKVLEDIRAAFEIAPDCAVSTGFYRPNLTLLTTPTSDEERDELLVRRLRERPAGPTIVYVTTQKAAERIAAALMQEGFDSRHYHAGMKSEEREATQDWFLKSDRGVVCATIAFGMGIDKPDIRYVYHYNLAKSLEGYAQEIGRAGRDGEPSTCEMFICLDDLATLENFAYGDTPTLDAVRSFVGDVFSQPEEFDVSQYDLSRDHDIRLLVVRTLLTYLELGGFLEGGTPFYSSYRFQPKMPSKEILAPFDDERRAFLAALLKQAKRGRTWFSLDAGEAAAALGVSRERVVAAIDYLGERGMLEVSAEGVRLRYRKLKTPKNLDALAKDLHTRSVEREKREVERIQQVVALSERDGCQVAALCEHFGERRDGPCGHCTWCLRNGKSTAAPSAKTPATPAARIEVAIEPNLWKKAEAVRREPPYKATLSEPQLFARFVCGITSPALQKVGLTKHPLFGCFERVPYKAVVERAGE